MAGEGVVLDEACGLGLWAARRHVRARRSDRGEGVYDPRGGARRRGATGHSEGAVALGPVRGVGEPMGMDDAQLRWALVWRVAGGDRC
jgi:hypothetical protein